MTKDELLAELAGNTYVMLKPSPWQGVGVFAVRDIPKGCRNMFSAPKPTDVFIKFTRQEVDDMPLHTKFMVENYCLYDADFYYVPQDGFKKMDLTYYINHSDNPNIISIDEGAYFEAIREIKTGEELLVDYGELVDDEEEEEEE